MRRLLQILKNVENEKQAQDLQVWCCDHCREVHFKARKVLLNFSQTEFANLTYAVNEIYQQEFGSLEFYKLVDLLKNKEALIGETVN